MNSMKDTSTERPDSDGDIGLLLYKTGHSIKQFFVWIGYLLRHLGRAFGVFLLFLFRNILWLIVGALAGLGYGYYNYQKKGTFYVSEMTVKANFNSSRALYNTVEYINSLISSANLNELARLFKISPDQAKQLVEVSAVNIESEFYISEMYREQFLQPDRTIRFKQDTFWLRTVGYEKFKESLTKFDYPMHRIEAKSTNAAIFPKLETGISNIVSANQMLRDVRDNSVISNNDGEKLLVNAIRGIDSLRQAYNQRLARGESTSPPAVNQLTLAPTASEPAVPELDLYDKLLELQYELKKARTKSATEKDVIEIYASFNPVGRRLTFLEQNGTRDILTGVLLSLILLCVIATFRWRSALEKQKKSIT